MKAVLPVVLVGLLVSACVNQREMPLADNVYRIQTEGRGLIAASQVEQRTMKRAAELTLERGYTHFRLHDASMTDRTEIIGMTGGTAMTTFNYGGGFGSGFTTYTPPQVIDMPVSTTGVTVVMYRQNEPGARGALDAEQILANLSS